MKDRGVYMQVNPVSLSNSTRPAFKSHADNLEILANMDDDTIRQIAYAKASHDVDDKKHKRISKALYLSLPVAAGLASAVKDPSNTVEFIKDSYKGLGKINLNRFARLNNFASSFLSLGTAILAIDATFGARKFLENKVDAVKDFSKDNPVLTTLATIGLSFGAISGANKLMSKALTKLTEKVSAKDILNSVTKKAEFLNNNKVLNYVSKKLAKVPSGIKNFGATVLDYSPILLICSSIAHSLGHEKAKASEYQNNYNNIVNAQALAREAIEYDS